MRLGVSAHRRGRGGALSEAAASRLGIQWRYHRGVGHPDELTEAFPIIPHESAGVDCCGCVIVAVRGGDAELRCNECGAVVGVVNVAILRDLVSLIPDETR